MSDRTRFGIRALFSTVACFLVYWTHEFRFFFLLLLPSLIEMTLEPGQLTKPVTFKLPKWDAFFDTLAIIFGCTLFFIVLLHLPREAEEPLFGKWYFTGILWLLLLSIQASRYVKDKQKAREPVAGNKPETRV